LTLQERVERVVELLLEGGLVGEAGKWLIKAAKFWC